MSLQKKREESKKLKSMKQEKRDEMEEERKQPLRRYDIDISKWMSNMIIKGNIAGWELEISRRNHWINMYSILIKMMWGMERREELPLDILCPLPLFYLIFLSLSASFNETSSFITRCYQHNTLVILLMQPQRYFFLFLCVFVRKYHQIYFNYTSSVRIIAFPAVIAEIKESVEVGYLCYVYRWRHWRRKQNKDDDGEDHRRD